MDSFEVCCLTLPHYLRNDLSVFCAHVC